MQEVRRALESEGTSLLLSGSRVAQRVKRGLSMVALNFPG